MSRLSLTLVPAVLFLAACNSPGDGTSQSESATVPADDGAMTAPDFASDTQNSGNGATTGAATTGSTTDGSMSGATQPPPTGSTSGTANNSGADASAQPTTGSDDQTGTPPPSGQ